MLPGLSGSPLQAAIRKAALTALGRAPRPVLDAGCGDGRLLERLPGGTTEGLLGCDFALSVLQAVAHRLPGHARLAGGRVQALPFRQGSVGTVVCVNTLYNLPSRAGLREALAEFARTVRSGGRLIFELRNPLHPVVRAVFWCNRSAERPLWTHGLPETRRTLDDSGFELSSISPVLGPCPSLALANLVVADRR
jgi:SAM-dependent methyltransferase